MSLEYLRHLVTVIFCSICLYVQYCLSANDTIDKNIRDLKIKFGSDNIPIENNRFPNMCWMPKLQKNPVKARFIIASPKSSIKP